MWIKKNNKKINYEIKKMSYSQLKQIKKVETKGPVGELFWNSKTDSVSERLLKLSISWITLLQKESQQDSLNGRWTNLWLKMMTGFKFGLFCPFAKCLKLIIIVIWH